MDNLRWVDTGNNHSTDSNKWEAMDNRKWVTVSHLLKWATVNNHHLKWVMDSNLRWAMGSSLNTGNHNTGNHNMGNLNMDNLNMGNLNTDSKEAMGKAGDDHLFIELC